MRDRPTQSTSFGRLGQAALLCTLGGLPGLALAQAAASPFDTGAQSLLTFMLTIAALVVAIIIIGVCIAAATSLISWGVVVRVIAGIAGVASVTNPADGICHRAKTMSVTCFALSRRLSREAGSLAREMLAMESTVQGETIEAPRKPEAMPAAPGMIRFEVEIPVEVTAEFDLMMYELFTGQRDRPEHFKRDDAAIAARAGEALATIVAAIRAHPGTGQAGRLVEFLASVYNGRDYPFDLSALRALGARLANACLAYLNYDRLAVSDLNTHLGDGGRELRAWIRAYGMQPSRVTQGASGR